MAHFLDPLLVAHLLLRVERAGLHIVLEAERVADFMRADILDETAHQIVRQGQLLRARVEWPDLQKVPVALQVHDVVIKLNVRV